MTQSNARITTIETRKIIAEAFQTHIRDERVIQATARIIEKITGEKQPTDALSAMLFGSPEARREKEILDTLEVGLKINIPRDSDTAVIAKNIRLDGRSVDAWVTWYRSDTFRLSSMPFMDIKKIWKMWPSAFDVVLKDLPAVKLDVHGIPESF